MSKQSVPLLILPIKATTAITEYRLVDFAGAQVTAADAVWLGVARRSAPAEGYVDISTEGTEVIEAGGVIAMGVLVYSDASGRVSTTGTTNPVGRALQAATAAGDFIEVLLNKR